MQSADLPYQVGEWVINPAQGIASREDEVIHLEPKSIQLLTMLASRQGEVISRTELLDTVWQGVVVGDDVLNNTVAKIRRSLQDDPRLPRLIETIPKKGYRLVATVRQPGPLRQKQSQKNRWLVAALLTGLLSISLAFYLDAFREPELAGEDNLPVPVKPSVVVLPFINLGSEKQQDYFADGMTDDLITDLSRVSSLFVIARNSSFVYKGRSLDVKQVARELGVKFVVEGSVRKFDDSIRVNVQLISAETGGNILADRFDGKKEALFDFQNRITERIVNALSVSMTGSEENYVSFQDTFNTEAYDAFLKGWVSYQQGTPESFSNAITRFNQSLKHDSSYGRAYAALAAVYWDTYRKRWHRRIGISPLSRVWEMTNENLQKSMIAPMPLAHKIASAMMVTNRRYEEAEVEAKRAIALDSNDPLGFLALAEVYVYTGKADKAESLIRKALRLDPNHRAPYLHLLGVIQLLKGELEKAIQNLEQVISSNPENRLSWMALISAYGAASETVKAKQAIASISKLQNNDKLVSFTVSNAREHWPFRFKEAQEQFLDGLRKAGVAEW